MARNNHPRQLQLNAVVLKHLLPAKSTLYILPIRRHGIRFFNSRHVLAIHNKFMDVNDNSGLTIAFTDEKGSLACAIK